ncbi:potassium-transporting ATPase subunit KdpA [Cryptosporangium aurantiacum]|uniref:Potassium-transporting ATPase potassium-binding subunit n=1 Tax=Cryptosporangium aurantiacum TaxID=134849 RepID=A0A1M7J200_9ACTN|nr:potassium-transporting ATPase subunit KdpA [Cryptosporangium aurantiacum]SHM47104.1 K+-transporting ATPase ATPase A chain [Cryptosporangium aurantiacum]
MSDVAAGLLQVLALFVALGFAWKYLGDYMARVYDTPKHSRVERILYRAVGVDPAADQRWPVYLRSVLAFSAVSVLGLYLLQRVQGSLPLSLGFPGVPPDLAFNTAASFVSNTNWQNYSGESTMGHLTQMAGLAVQNFVSAAVGMAVAVALIRGFVRKGTDRLGNFWVDLFRGSFRILLPLAVVSTLVLVAAGAVQNLASPHEVTTLAGGSQTITGGPVASQEAIKELGTNGGGFYNANSAHPFENPNAFSNWFEIFLLLLIPVALTRTFGRLIGQRRQGLAILGAMTTIFVGLLAVVWTFEAHFAGAMEGKEVRFGVPGSALFATATTGTSTGAVNAFHDSFSAIGGGALMLNMLLGEVAPGGVGSGLYGILVMAILAVFVAGLMVGRTPEFLGKKIQGREIKLVSLYILATPIAVLVGAGLAMSFSSTRDSMLNSGPHGFSEVLYAFASGGNNNGSCFCGLTGNTPFYNTALGLAMLVGRFLPIVFVLALAGSLARQQPVPVTEGTLPTHRTLFVGLLVGVVLVVTGLTYFPVLSLGPLAEGL